MQLLLMQPAQLEVFFPCPSADAEQCVTVSKHERVLSRKPWLVFSAGCCPWHLLICHLHRGHMAWESAHRKLQAAHTDALMRSRPYKVTCGHQEQAEDVLQLLTGHAGEVSYICNLQRICCCFYIG